MSGANCAIVVGLAFGLAALCGAGRGLRAGIALTVLAGFVVLVTPEPSVVRAAVMAVIGMLAILLGRVGAGVSVLALAVAVILAFDPWLALSYGFVLSAAATGALLLLAPPLTTALGRWMPGPLALALSVPLSAHLVCAPIIVLLDPALPAFGVIANLLAAPAAPAATVLGFAACLALPLPWVQDGLVALAWLPASWIGGTATTLAALPGAAQPWLPGGLGAAALLAVHAAVLVAVLPSPPGRRRRMLRVAAATVLAGVVGVVGGSAAVRTVAGPLTVPSGWAVAICDVGQGDAVLLRSGGRTALVDTGEDPTLLTACLDRFGVGRLDLLVLTHFDLDHVGAVSVVQGRVDTVVHGPADTAADDRLLAALAGGGADVVAVTAGMQGTLGAARWEVLWPRGDADTPGNDASVVLDVRGADLPSILLLGDLSAETQGAVRRGTGFAPPYDVVKVAHHGSADQDAGLYAAAAPRVALIGVGVDNDYDHPRQSILDVLAATGATIARTDTHGAAAVWTESGELRLWRDRAVGAAE